MAARSGASTIIASGREPNVLGRLCEGEVLGTLLQAAQPPIAARKQWLAGQLQSRGSLAIDDGAVAVLRNQGRSLLPVGIRTVHGQFSRGDLVRCVTLEGEEVARGLVNYSADEVKRIAGVSSQRIAEVLGYRDYEEVIHRDNMVVL